ncbi:MAG: hypothetical protein RR959_06145 [Erysipelotrichaceae bacterium]
MKTYEVSYKIGSFGYITFNVEIGVPQDHKDFDCLLQGEADRILLREVEFYGIVDQIFPQD